MFVRVDVEAGTIELAEAADCGRFHVEAPNGSAQDVLRVLGAAASHGDDQHVWLHPDAIRSLHPDGVSEAWEADFAAMVVYAQSKGWVDEAGAIRAHIEQATT